MGLVVATFVLSAPAGPSSLAGRTGPLGPGGRHAPLQVNKSGSSMATSVNWAGYAVAQKGVTFTDVSGSWQQPSVSCPTKPQQDASFWVGIDGFQKGSTTVEQIGTDSDCAKVNKKKKTGGPTYYAWWEMYPALATPITTPSTYIVSPGDSMHAEVATNGTSFTMTLIDQSKNWTFTTTQTPSSPAAQSSAEWIAEAPSSCAGCAPSKLADFGSVTFSGLSVTASTSPPAATAINMAKGKKIKAQTTPISSSSFLVQWEHN